VLVHPEITPPSNFYHFRDTTKSLPALDTLMAIAQVLGVPVQALLPEQGLDGDKSPNRIRLEAEAQAILRGLSDDRAKIALAQLKALAGA